MSIKRIESINGVHKCLKCGSPLTDIEKGVAISTCSYCGQQAFIDIMGNTMVLTAVERAEYRPKQATESAAPKAEEYDEAIKELRGMQKRLDMQAHEQIRSDKEKDEQIGDLKRQLTEQRQETQSLQKQLIDAQKRQASKEQLQAMKDKDAKIKELQKQLKDKEKQNGLLEDLVEELKANLENVRNNLIEGNKALYKAKADAKDWEQAAEGLARKLEELKEQGAW